DAAAHAEAHAAHDGARGHLALEALAGEAHGAREVLAGELLAQRHALLEVLGLVAAEHVHGRHPEALLLELVREGEVHRVEAGDVVHEDDADVRPSLLHHEGPVAAHRARSAPRWKSAFPNLGAERAVGRFSSPLNATTPRRDDPGKPVPSYVASWRRRVKTWRGETQAPRAESPRLSEAAQHGGQVREALHHGVRVGVHGGG